MLPRVNKMKRFKRWGESDTTETGREVWSKQDAIENKRGDTVRLTTSPDHPAVILSGSPSVHRRQDNAVAKRQCTAALKALQWVLALCNGHNPPLSCWLPASHPCYCWIRCQTPHSKWKLQLLTRTSMHKWSLVVQKKWSLTKNGKDMTVDKHKWSEKINVKMKVQDYKYVHFQNLLSLVCQQ